MLVMKKSYLFVFLLGVFFVCSCGNSNKKGDVYMAYMDELESCLNEGIVKIQESKNMEELECVDEWLGEKKEAVDKKAHEYAEKHPDEFERYREQLRRHEGVYYDKQQKVLEVLDEFYELYEKRMVEFAVD